MRLLPTTFKLSTSSRNTVLSKSGGTRRYLRHLADGRVNSIWANFIS